MGIMKQLVFILSLLVSTLSLAQGEINKSIGEFTEIKVFDLIEVNMIQSNENRVIIKGEDTDYVKIINENGKLKIRMDIDKRFNGDATFVEVYYTSVQEIDANEGAFITLNETLKQDRLELRSQEGGHIKAGLEVNNLEVRSVTGGIIEASGTANAQNVTINTGGIYQAEDLVTNSTKVTIAAGGEAAINASQKAELKVTAGGDIYVYGEPTELKKKTFAGGRIKRMY